jgi:hypothetical protein
LGPRLLALTRCRLPLALVLALALALALAVFHVKRAAKQSDDAGGRSRFSTNPREMVSARRCASTPRERDGAMPLHRFDVALLRSRRNEGGPEPSGTSPKNRTNG